MVSIKFDDLVLGEQLATGGSATVYRGRWESRDMTVAIKTSSPGITTGELDIMKLVDHPNLLHFYGTVVQPLAFCIVTEYMEQGAIFDFLHQNEFNSDRNLMWARQIAAGMKYLHFDVPDRVVIHGDLKSKNVLIAADNTAKICDFGSSKVRNQLPGVSIHTTTKVHGTPRWMAPEVLETKPISKQCDVYSYGIVVWELLTHKIPFEDVTTIYEICKRVVEDKERPPIPEDCSPALANLLRKCWDPNPKVRPEFTEIVSNMKHLRHMIIGKEQLLQSQSTPQMCGVEKPEDMAPEEEIYDQPEEGPEEIYVDILSEEEERLEEERKKKQEMEEEKREVVRLKKRQDGLRTYKVLEDQPEMEGHLGVTTGERVLVLLFIHAKLPDGLYLVEKEDGTIGYVKKNITKRVVYDNVKQIHSKPQPAFPSKATSGQQYYSAIYDYTAADVDEVSFVENDIIVDCQFVDEWWMEGRVQRTGQCGMIPSNYVELQTSSIMKPLPEEHSSASDVHEGSEDHFSGYEEPQQHSYVDDLHSTKADKPQLYEDAHPNWAVSREEVELLDDKLGSGEWGIVTKARFRGEIVAAKHLHEELVQENPDFLYKAIRRELDIASILRHPNLVLFLGAAVEGELTELIILNELMDSSLSDVLAEGQLSRSQIKSLSIDIARALNYLHSCKPQPLIHRDVSSANVLLQRLSPDYWKAKLSGYGSLKAINLACTLTPGNSVYAAPEAVHVGQQSCKMDTYSFGVLLIEMFSRQLPTPELRARMLQEIKWREMHMLIETCIRAYPNERPEMQQIISSLESMPEMPSVQQPINDYVEMSWFIPSISRVEAENKLATEGKEGNFLVRFSTSKGSKYSLSVFHNGRVYHYRIWQSQSNELYIDDVIRFQSLEEMMEFYKTQGGLLTKLREYVPIRQGGLKDQSSLIDKAWEISRTELTCGSEIAKGQCGYVVAGELRGFGVAIRVTKQDILDEAGLQFIGDAINDLKEFQHKNLVKFHGICRQKGSLLIVTELMPRGSLDKYIKQHQELLNQKKVILDMSTQICSALKFLETKGIFHGDLAARNCLVGEMNVVKVADYSLALYTSSRKPSRTVVSVKWAAPELIVQQPMFTTKSDVWSFGVLMWELWSGALTPYLDLRNQEVKGKLLAGHRLGKPGNCPDEVYNLMQKCWSLNDQKRPSFAHLHEKLCSLDVHEEFDEGLEIPKSELTFGCQLGKGGCGYLAAGTWKTLDVAIRVTNEKVMSGDGHYFIEEAISVLKEFQHEKLLKLYGICSQEAPVLYIITELLTKGRLNVYLKEHPVLVEKVEALLDMATQVCSAMKFLESKEIVHKDVAARNCLVGERNVIKLADFSLPLFTSERTTSSNCVPIRWTAPEILKGGQYSIKSDIWSFGVLLWELWTAAQEPYSGLHNQQVTDLVIAGHRLEKPEHCPRHVYELMKSCWIDAEQRTSFAALYDDLRSLGNPDDIFGVVTKFKRRPSKPAPKHSSVAVLYDSALEISKQQLKFGKELTSGKYGYMMSGWWKNKEVAIRVANDNALTVDGLEFIEEAVTAMKKFEHPNLLKLYGLCTRQGALFVVTELLQQQETLLNYIRRRQELLEDEALLLNLATQICAAMEFLETKGILHKDLATRNCVIGENDMVKVTDFSLSMFNSDRKPVKTCFPIKWSAPEVLMNGPYSTKSDVWSYGVLLWEIWSGGMLPYPDLELQKVSEQVLTGYRLFKPKTCSQQVYNLMQQCWQMKPEDRPSFMVLHRELTHLEQMSVYDEIPDIIDTKQEKEKKKKRLKNRQKGLKTYKQFGLSCDDQPLFAVEVLLDQLKKKDYLGVTTRETVNVLRQNHPMLPDGVYLVEKEDGTIGYLKKNITKRVNENTQKEQSIPFSQANSGEECHSVYDYIPAASNPQESYSEVGYVTAIPRNKSQKEQPASPSKATSEEQLYSAIYDYTAADDDEVSFVEGDIIVERTLHEGWMEGCVKRTGKCGLLPSNYVKKI